MVRQVLIQVALSILPVLLFLAALELIDTYKLVTLRRVIRSIAIGAGVAIVCYSVNTSLYRTGIVAPEIWARFGAPWLEEIAKALYVMWLIRSNRVGFMVDTAIAGFAVGAGFAALENLTYIPDLSAAGLTTSAIRGLGTAIMHGGTTAIFGTLSSTLSAQWAQSDSGENSGFRSALRFVPGLLLAGTIHMVYNQPWLSPIMSAVCVLVLLPPVIALIFWRSEKALEKWMSAKLDQDIDLLENIESGNFNSSRAGAYLKSLEGAFPADVLGDMLCYLQLTLELSARAKGDLLRREMGFPVIPDTALPAQFRELRWLESRMGRAGQRALVPLLGQSKRDVWELQQLGEKTEGGPWLKRKPQ
jgi:RsiW-degrading membrane proteinase PrsW (M82 family)